MAGARIAVLATASATGDRGGAERFYLGLRDALCRQGADAELVEVVSDEADFDAIKRSYLRFYDLDLGRFEGVISTKAPGHVVRHPRHVCYLQHTMRVFYDMFEREFPEPWPELFAQRALIQRLDTAALRRLGPGRRFVIGEQVRERLRVMNGLDAEVLYQASTLPGCHEGPFRHLLLPGRLHRWKRVDLAIAAMRHVQAPVPLLITGTGEDEAPLRALAGDDLRIRFLGRVTDEELVALYAGALAVLFVPVSEDFGLVTLEAFRSAKPVVTCSDAGEPARLVRDGVSGFVCAAEATEIARRIDRLWGEPDLARRLGAAGRESIARVSWDATARRLLAALELE